jgi:PAS domain S-box-containing protein
MLQSIKDFFNSAQFMPHGYCFMWHPGILWLHVISDSLIVLAYFLIPFALIYFMLKRKDLPFQMIFLWFGAFILLCGTTHFMSIWVLWHPDYGVEGIIKAMTAVTSIVTFFLLVKLIPQALLLPSPKQLRIVNEELQAANRQLEVLFQQTRESGEAHLRAVVNNILDGLITIDEAGLIQSFNPASERIFGYQVSEVIGQNIKTLMPEPYHAEHDEYLAQYFATGNPKIIGSAGRELSAKRKDGSIFPMELGISEYRVAGERAFVGIIRDISERKEAEAQLLRYTQALERSNKDLDDFAYIASHDLKEPLRGIFNNAKFLQEDYENILDENGNKLLQRLGYLSKRMEQLVNDLLYFSRLSKQELAIQSTDLNLVVRDIESLMENTIQEQHAIISIPKTLPQIVCDKPRITEVFRNLITNAIKYNDKAQKIIEVGCLEQQRVHEQIESQVFYVKDNGIGIEPEFYEEIFRIFKRLNEEDDEKKGTGVGLTFVRKIIERHGGEIWLDSQPGIGTIFYFTIKQGALHGKTS